MSPLHKPFVFFDVDNTLLKGQSQRYCIQYFYEKGLISFCSYVKILLWFIFYKLGLKKDPRAIMEYAFKFAKGMSYEKFSAEVGFFFNNVLKDKIYTQSLELLRKHQSEGFEVVLVTNAFETLAQKISDYVDASHVLATRLARRDGLLTGKIEGEIVYGQEKARLIQEFIKNSHTTLAGSYGYGDHGSDISFLELVEHPVAINPERKLFRRAKKRGWQIIMIKA